MISCNDAFSKEQSPDEGKQCFQYHTERLALCQQNIQSLNSEVPQHCLFSSFLLSSSSILWTILQFIKNSSEKSLIITHMRNILKFLKKKDKTLPLFLVYGNRF